ncbi:hypothetical protein Jinkies_25 [Arthrobacter phage Jinkies]|uniref:Uncharacterized protein n=1 Tax=Arthrobacter phage Jinkies TaxID=2743903 RepID=A0A7S5WWE3_9CAUD|nr:hypothetical protein Jinkies_25 [Arthrobacter phage Jinkies]
MTVWAGLIVSRVLRLADSLLPTGAECDALLGQADGPRVELAEPLSLAASAQGIEIPRNDEHLRLFLAVRNAAAKVDLNVRGLVVVTPGLRLGLTVGRGRVVESYGAGLTVILTPGPGRYSEAFRVPGVQLLGGA